MPIRIGKEASENRSQSGEGKMKTLDDGEQGQSSQDEYPSNERCDDPRDRHCPAPLKAVNDLNRRRGTVLNQSSAC